MSQTPSTTPRSKQIERRIYFFRLDAGSNGDGTAKPVDLGPALEAIDDLPFTSESRRYWGQKGGDDIALWTHGKGDRFSLAAVRRANLPRSESGGTLTDLALGAAAGLHEPIHVRIYGHNLLGVESNFYGPRISRLAPYLQHALGERAPQFAAEALLRQDSAERLNHVDELRVVELYLRPSYIDQVHRASKSLGNAFEAMNGLSKAEVLGLTLRPEPNQRTPLGSKILKGIKKVAGRADMPDNVHRFKAKGVTESGRVEAIDLLEDQLVTKRKIVTMGARSRAVDPQATFDAIDEAYGELESELIRATGLSTKP
ncbi:MAG: hypothetical protein K0Q52_91 [Microbacterium sp.]|jgi:hypothetical protein|nr:hypothetical protein [Microbacterium sp.]